ncbi:class I SAM-dependent methyltransferase [Methylogaea oryzae]|uniref:class I SAM-dependent methyltransferase n=1 Tax=Methylogaea oryzae TaxID=1295382 RepID=UPI001FE658D3|nr:class I SAM-dependent methyltransferase [Methylogaea oryzae]
MVDNAHLLPPSGRALDLACGLGGNALLLARLGLRVHAWDISPVAVERLRLAAAEPGLAIDAEVRDAENAPWPQAFFDVIVVSRFLCRPLAGPIAAALKPGGLLFYQTFVGDKAEGIGPSNPDYLLERNELLRLFAGLRVIAYREEGLVGDMGRGFRNEAMLVAQQA